MITSILVAGTLIVLPAKDTVWWDTPGGKVMEHRDQTAANCTLMLYDGDSSVTFAWDNPGRTMVIAINANWQFPDNRKMPIAMQLGDVWLSNGGGSVVIDAVGRGNAVTFSTVEPIDQLLRLADRIVVRIVGSDMSIGLRRGKMDALLSRLRLCRAATGR